MNHKFKDYFEYESLLANGILIPFIKSMGIPLQGKRVLDVGCGEGGIMYSLAEHFEVEGLGIDYDEDMIKGCRPIKGVEFKNVDFLKYDFQDKFDFILLRDVLEHCVDIFAMLSRIASLLSDKGLVYITYTPYLSPFGGHQHNGTSIFANFPYIQFLPERLFLKFINPSGNIYKTSRYLVEDLNRIRKTWLTTCAVMEMLKKCSLKIVFKRMFIIRPDYLYRFGLPAVAIPSFIPLMTALDLFSTSVELLVMKV
jgi:ubiquinone/menaquinone biosynthesis C-methylase UbiE